MSHLKKNIAANDQCEINEPIKIRLTSIFLLSLVQQAFFCDCKPFTVSANAIIRDTE